MFRKQKPGRVVGPIGIHPADQVVSCGRVLRCESHDACNQEASCVLSVHALPNSCEIRGGPSKDCSCYLEVWGVLCCHLTCKCNSQCPPAVAPHCNLRL